MIDHWPLINPGQFEPCRTVCLRELSPGQLQVILEGELKPGDKLNEVEIARRLGVSRGPVREAVRQLQEAGLLESQPFRGAFVRALNQRQVADIYVLRTLLETAAVADAIRFATPADLAAIERAMHETETAALANAKGRMIEADVAFHSAICRAGHNERIADTFIKLASELRLVHLLMSPTAEQLRAAAKSHGVILNDIRSRDADRAVSAVRRHINDERDSVLQYLGPHGDSITPLRVEHEIAEEPPAGASLRGRIKVNAHQREDFALLARMNRELSLVLKVGGGLVWQGQRATRLLRSLATVAHPWAQAQQQFFFLNALGQ